MKILKFLNLPTVNKDVASLIIKRVMQSDIEGLAMLRCTDKTTKRIIDELLNSGAGAKMVIDEFARLAGEPSSLPIDIDPQQWQFDPKLFYKLKDFCLWAGFTKNWRNLKTDNSIIAYALTTQDPTELVTNQKLFAKLVNALRNPEIPLITKDMVARSIKIVCAKLIPAHKQENSASRMKCRISIETKYQLYLESRYKETSKLYLEHLKRKNIKFSESSLDEMTIKFLKRRLLETDANNHKNIQYLKDLINHAQKSKLSTQKLSLISISFGLCFQDEFNDVISDINTNNSFAELESQLTCYNLATNSYTDNDGDLPITNDLSRDHYCMTNLPLNYIIPRVINSRNRMYSLLESKYKTQWPWCNLENVNFATAALANPLNLQYADLRTANFVKFKSSRYQQLVLNDDMKGSRLTKANLQQTYLNSNLDGAILDKTLFYGSRIVTDSQADFSKAKGVSMSRVAVHNKKLSTSQRFRRFAVKHGYKIALVAAIPGICFWVVVILGVSFSVPGFVTIAALLSAFSKAFPIIFNISSGLLTAIMEIGILGATIDRFVCSVRFKKNITPTTMPAHNQEQRPDTDSQLRDLFNPKPSQTRNENPLSLQQNTQTNQQELFGSTVQSKTGFKSVEKHQTDIHTSLFSTIEDDTAQKNDKTIMKSTTEQQPDFRTDVEKSGDTSSSQSLFQISN